MKAKIIVLVSLLCASSINTDENLNRIIGGKVATIGHYPFMVAIRTANYPHCGGSIIGVDTVLTAGHCISKILKQKSGTVHVGETVILGGGQSFPIKSCHIHPDYNEKLDHDIAIIKIEGKFLYNDKVQPITLATQEVPEGSYAVISGWGNTETNGRAETTSVELRPLKAAGVPIVDNKKCAAAYAPLNKTISDKVICAGYIQGGVDSCQGDSGGPLVCNQQQIGVVSWGEGCADSRYPGVYTKVKAYLPWIQRTMLDEY